MWTKEVETLGALFLSDYILVYFGSYQLQAYQDIIPTDDVCEETAGETR